MRLSLRRIATRGGLRNYPRVLVALAACLAACAPSTFDNITGGTTDADRIGKPHEAEFITADKSLDNKDPRPIGPFSSSWVNTARPHFKWVLQQGTTGAMLELSRSPKFENDVKRIPVTGSDHPMTEDLAAGVWFWRLQARSPSGQGTTYSKTWEVLVRGPSQSGSSEVPHGGIVDFDMDGTPEIIVSVIGNVQVDDKGTIKPSPALLELFGMASAADVVTYDASDYVGFDAGDDKPSFAAGFDIDGDGFGDMLVGTIWPASPPSQPQVVSELFVAYGGAKRVNSDKPDDDYLVMSSPFTTTPTLATGDYNGDGYGDVSALFPSMGTTYLGSAHGLSSMLNFATAPTAPAGATTFPLTTTDLDNDGNADLTFAPFDTTDAAPVQFVKGASGRFSYPANIAVAVGGEGDKEFKVPGRAIAMAAGDFDGDALEEVAFTTILKNGKAAVCIHSPLKAMNAHGCWTSDAPAAGFGITLKAADLDADGRDDLLVGSTGGIVALSHAGKGFDGADSVYTATPITGAYTPSFSVIHPGRPGKARWVAMGTDAKSIFIHEGIGDGSLKQTIDFSKLNKQDYDFVRLGSTIR